MLSSASIQQKFFQLAEIVHLRIFGHEMGGEMRKFLGNLSWSFFGGIIAAVILFAVNILAGRILGSEEYGKYHIILVFGQILVIPMVMGLNTAVARHAAAASLQLKNTIKNTAFFSLLLSTLFFAVLFLSVLPLFPIPYDIGFFSIIFAVALSFVYFFRALYQGFQRIKELSLIDAFGMFIIALSFSFFLWFSPLEKDFRILLYSFFIGYAVFVAISVVRFSRFSIKSPSLSLLKLLWGYGKFAVAGGIAGVLLGGADKLILARYLGSDVVGVYSAYLLASTMLFSQLVQIFVSAFFPAISALRRKDLAIGKVLLISKWSVPLVFMASVPIMYVVMILFGEDYSIRLSYVTLFSLAAAFSVSYQIKMWFLNAEGVRGVKITVVGVLAFGFFGLILNAILVPLYSIYGAVTALITSAILLDIYFSRKIITIIPYEKYPKD